MATSTVIANFSDLENITKLFSKIDCFCVKRYRILNKDKIVVYMITITKYVDPTLDNFSLSIQYRTTDRYCNYNEYYNSFHVDIASVIYYLRNIIDFQALGERYPGERYLEEPIPKDMTDNSNKLPQIGSDFLSEVLNNIMNIPTN